MNKKSRFIINILMYSMIFMLMFPLAVLLVWSFARNWPWPDLIPGTFGLRGYAYIFSTHSKSIQTLLFSFWLSLVVTIVTLAISIPAAKALGVYSFKGREFIKLFILTPIIVPTVAVAMGLHTAFIKMGLANTFIGVVLVHLIPCLPYGVRILTNVFEITGESLEMQARVLGASPFQTFVNITLPMIIPGIVSAGSLIFIVSFSQYFLTFLIGGGRIVTFSMMMFPFIQSGDRMMASSYSIIFIATTMIFLSMMEKMLKIHYNAKDYFYI